MPLAGGDAPRRFGACARPAGVSGADAALLALLPLLAACAVIVGVASTRPLGAAAGSCVLANTSAAPPPCTRVVGQGAEMWALALPAPAVHFAPRGGGSEGGCSFTRMFVSAGECAAFAPQALLTAAPCWSVPNSDSVWIRVAVTLGATQEPGRQCMLRSEQPDMATMTSLDSVALPAFVIAAACLWYAGRTVRRVCGGRRGHGGEAQPLRPRGRAPTRYSVHSAQSNISGVYDAADACVVCLDAPLAVVLLPCRHLCACPACAQRLARCPICRAPATDRMKVHLPSAPTTPTVGATGSAASSSAGAMQPPPASPRPVASPPRGDARLAEPPTQRSFDSGSSSGGDGGRPAVEV